MPRLLDDHTQYMSVKEKKIHYLLKPLYVHFGKMDLYFGYEQKLSDSDN